MEIYEVKNGELHSAEVLKETPKTYKIKRIYAFNYCSIIHKEGAHTKPIEAIEAAIKNKNSEVIRAEEKLTHARKDLNKLYSLQRRNQ